MSGLAFIEGCPHSRGNLYEGYHAVYYITRTLQWLHISHVAPSYISRHPARYCNDVSMQFTSSPQFNISHAWIDMHIIIVGVGHIFSITCTAGSTSLHETKCFQLSSYSLVSDKRYNHSYCYMICNLLP